MALKKGGANWVSGESFYNRDFEIATLTERIHAGTHTLISAPRRMGKTSLVREVLERLQTEGSFDTIFVDVEDAETAAHAVADIAARSKSVLGIGRRAQLAAGNAAREVRQRLQGIGAPGLGVKLQATIDSFNWRRNGDALFSALAAAPRNGRRVVLALDELSLFIGKLLGESAGEIPQENVLAADTFLSWLRKNAQEHKGRVSLIVLGSVSLEPILSRAGLTAHANTFSPLELKPWDEATACACLGELAETYDIEVPIPVRKEMCQRLGYLVPHHVQRFFDLLHDELRSCGRHRATASDANRVYTEQLLRRGGKLDLPHWESRLRLALGARSYKIANSLLTEAAAHGGVLLSGVIVNHMQGPQTPDGLQPQPDSADASTMEHVLDVLEHDGYLARDGDDYHFRSNPLRDWWRDRHRFSSSQANGSSANRPRTS